MPVSPLFLPRIPPALITRRLDEKLFFECKNYKKEMTRKHPAPWGWEQGVLKVIKIMI